MTPYTTPSRYMPVFPSLEVNYLGSYMDRVMDCSWGMAGGAIAPSSPDPQPVPKGWRKARTGKHSGQQSRKKPKRRK